MSRSPVSWPTGAAPARHNLMPLYWAGLWLAVNIAPGRPRKPEAKYRPSVLANPVRTTSQPCSRTPSANEATSDGPDGRMSCAMTTRPGSTVTLGRTDDADERRTDGVSEVLVELVGIGTADVVRLDDVVEVPHARQASDPRHRSWS